MTTKRKPKRFVKLFQSRFVPNVQDGTKTTTIRPKPKRPCDWPQPGDTLDAREWQGKPYRSEQQLIGMFRIKAVKRVKIDLNTDTITTAEVVEHVAVVTNIMRIEGGKNDALQRFAKADGFADYCDLATWFFLNHGKTFEGVLIEWEGMR